eukprot:CAMPEP_0177546258 /NCGR_PEP_ID=MMETSP0369-20130122/63119_1 /TAXON_ID=447022 ORGANISM="Scrippsiella hangoei-like, Strain SHHI-4" /NCGR_SAMPLE_ID=MMETSP0369 /ASSEMBLY_ACC=CAM_ASM_000364 /LENGTH=71 /DNA_ID=CAMNT_0019030733 /DNA_START=68 /DNA_END=283 /DNA_ORIENTATION=+
MSQPSSSCSSIQPNSKDLHRGTRPMSMPPMPRPVTPHLASQAPAMASAVAAQSTHAGSSPTPSAAHSSEQK